MEGWPNVKRVVFAVAAHQRRAAPAAAATAPEMGLLMAYWELMARYYDRCSTE